MPLRQLILQKLNFLVLAHEGSGVWHLLPQFIGWVEGQPGCTVQDFVAMNWRGCASGFATPLGFLRIERLNMSLGSWRMRREALVREFFTFQLWGCGGEGVATTSLNRLRPRVLVCRKVPLQQDLRSIGAEKLKCGYCYSGQQWQRHGVN